MMILSGAMYTRLLTLARKEAYADVEEFANPTPYGSSGGNFDDCFQNGFDEGEILLAREILTSMGVSW